VTPPSLSDRDLLVLIVLLMVTGALSAVDAILQMVHPTQSFVDFVVLFGLGWGAYKVGKMSD